MNNGNVVAELEQIVGNKYATFVEPQRPDLLAELTFRFPEYLVPLIFGSKYDPFGHKINYRLVTIAKMIETSTQFFLVAARYAIKHKKAGKISKRL